MKPWFLVPAEHRASLPGTVPSPDRRRSPSSGRDELRVAETRCSWFVMPC